MIPLDLLKNALSESNYKAITSQNITCEQIIQGIDENTKIWDEREKEAK